MSALERMGGGAARLERLTRADINDGVVEAVGAFFRYTFSNAFGELYVRQSTGDLLSAAQAAGGYLPLAAIDGCPPALMLNGELLPKVFDPATTHAKLNDKLREHDSVLARLFDETGAMRGMTFAYHTTLGEAFAYEWRYPWAYVAERYRQPERLRAVGRAIAGLHRGGWPAVGETTPVLCWNCVATAPEARSLANFLALAGTLFAGMEGDRQLLVIGETLLGSTAYGLFQAAGAVAVPGVLEPPLTLVCTRLGDAVANYGRPVREFIRLIRAARG